MYSCDKKKNLERCFMSVPISANLFAALDVNTKQNNQARARICLLLVFSFVLLVTVVSVTGAFLVTLFF